MEGRGAWATMEWLVDRYKPLHLYAAGTFPSTPSLHAFLCDLRIAMAYRSDTLRVACGRLGGDHRVCATTGTTRKKNKEGYVYGDATYTAIMTL